MVVIYLGIQWFVTNKGAVRSQEAAGCGLYLIIIAGYTHERVKVWENMDTLQLDILHITERHLGRSPSEAMDLINIPICKY